MFCEPAWFCYEPMLLAADAVPLKLKLKPPGFDLDLAAIEAAIGPRTRLVIVNTPHNPTGRIYDRDELAALAEVLDARVGANSAGRCSSCRTSPTGGCASTGAASSARPRSIRGP